MNNSLWKDFFKGKLFIRDVYDVIFGALAIIAIYASW